MLITSQQQDDFARDGYLLLKGVFSAAEIARYRELGATFPTQLSYTRYCYQIPELADWWADERLLGIARKLLGLPVVYFFGGHFQRYVFPPGQPIHGRHMHHDAKGSPENPFNRVNAPVADYPVIRMIVYLQDTKNQSGGLKIVPGSHRIDVSSFEHSPQPYNVPAEPGDLVVFTHRIIHSPFALRLRRDPLKALTAIEEDTLWSKDPDAFLPTPSVREALFIDYAAIAESADLFIKNRALVESAVMTDLASYLIEDGFLQRHEGHEVQFRIDRAIHETVTAIRSHVVDGQVGPKALPHLKRLPLLCRAHWESSEHYPLFEMDVPDDSLETARLLFNDIEFRRNRYLAMRKETRSDPHMVGLSPATLEAMRRQAKTGTEQPPAQPASQPPATPAYNPKNWKHFHPTRRLSFPTRKIVKPGTRIFTMGSCFAMELRRALGGRGFKMYPDYAAVPYDRSVQVFDKIPERETLAHYDTFSMRQEFEAALGGWADRPSGFWPVTNAPANKILGGEEVYQDPYRKLVYAKTRPLLETLADRVTAAIRDGIERSDVIVLTLGLTEVWRHKLTGRYLCRPPGTGLGGGIGLAEFRQSTFLENYQNMRALLDLLFARYPEKEVVISVSPVALEATYSQFDVGTANNESKAILRAVAAQICREYDRIMYFPSYEMATLLKLQVYEDDGRHVLRSFADYVIGEFLSAVSTS
jgi:hypothetical protein